MSDIIKDAKQLLDGVTSGKWRAADSDIIAEDSNRFIATVSEYSGLDEPSEEYANVQLIAAAPELAQALAEETWEYTQEIYFDGKWQPIYEDLWFETPEECDGLWLDIEPWKWNNEPLRIVRRRVSPMEVING